MSALQPSKGSGEINLGAFFEGYAEGKSKAEKWALPQRSQEQASSNAGIQSGTAGNALASSTILWLLRARGEMTLIDLWGATGLDVAEFASAITMLREGSVIEADAGLRPSDRLSLSQASAVSLADVPN